MSLLRLLFWLARLYFGLFVLLTSGYCLLTYIPFTYHQFLKAADLLPWLTVWVSFHPCFYWTALAAAGATLMGDLRRPGAQILTKTFLASHAVFGIWLLFRPLLPRLQNDATSLAWSLVSLIPLGWLAGIDLIGHLRMVRWSHLRTGEDSRQFHAAWQSAVFLSLVYAGMLPFRRMLPGSAVMGGMSEWAAGFVCSLILHLLLFMGLVAVLNLIRALAAAFFAPAKTEFVLLHVVLALLLSAWFGGIVFPAISLQGVAAGVYAAAAGSALAAFLAGLSIRLFGDGEAASGLDVQITVLTICRQPSRLARVIGIPLLCVLAYQLGAQTSAMDWNGLFHRLAVWLLWAIAFAWLYRFLPASSPARAPSHTLLLLPLAILIVYKTLQFSEPRLPLLQATVRTGLDSYGDYNPSLKVIREALTRSRIDSSFYRFLAQNSNLPASAQVFPVEVKLVSDLKTAAGPKPNIFIFVFDSLRRDYLSPYNDAVNFTPSIESFARESVVLRNAFTPYGGTGLSEPSLWAGAMLLHKQYVLPFSPMNALAKLLAADNYENYVSLDTILDAITAGSLPVIELDRGVLNMNFDLCRSLDELQTKISARTDSGKPLFAYTQPQNLHISVIRRAGAAVAAGESYPGFYAPYASRVRRMDQCFGGFIRFLKWKGLYEDSIVVLTSDHGDSLGEDGRWGHAYTLFPEIIRVPIIVHMPSKIRAGLIADLNRVAMLTDITPSLYYLLGHRPVERNAIYGRPLFTATMEEQLFYQRDNFLIASSYAAVFGLLSDNGQRLYIFDAVNYKNYLYAPGAGPGGTRLPSSDAAHARGERYIREHLLAISRFYGYTPAGEPRLEPKLFGMQRPH